MKILIHARARKVVHLANGFFQPVGINAHYRRQLANRVGLGHKAGIKPFLWDLPIRLHGGGHKRAHHKIASESGIENLPGWGVGGFVRVGGKQLLLKGHVILRFVSEALTRFIDNAGAREGFFHNG